MAQLATTGRSVGTPSLSDLVSQSRRLASAIERDRNGLGSDLPSINLALDQLESQSRSLAAGGSSGVSAGAESKAHYFLASAGIDAFTLSQDINQTNIASAFEPLEPLQDTDVQSYLQHEQQQIILSAIEEGRRETLENFNRNLARTMHSRWSRQKKRIFEELGQHQVGSLGNYSSGSSRQIAAKGSAGRAGLLTSSSATSDPPLTSLSMHTKLMSYDTVIRSLNQNRLKEAPFALASELFRTSQASVGGPGETQTPLAECWMAVKNIVGEDQRGNVPREREYSAAYFDAARLYGSPDGQQLRSKIAKGARTFLEAQFETHVDNIIASNPSKAQLGGQPGIVSRVTAFLRVSLLSREGKWAPDLELVKRSSTSAALPLWATVFHLLRTGHAADALRQVEDYEGALRRGDGGFVGWFREWIESGGRGLSRTSRDRFFAEYNARFRNLSMGGNSSTADASGIDPHKIALYRLVGRVDSARKFPPALTRSTENWLWLQLMMTREPFISGGAFGGAPSTTDDVEEDERERYTLEDLARKLRTYGEHHFDPKGRRPLHYFLVLLLSGEFERGVAFLYSRPQHQADAVHFAITLAYYGLLRCPSPQEIRSAVGGEILITRSDTAGREIPSLHFARIISRHIRLFSSSDARSALEYLYLICLNVESAVASETQEDQRQRCYDAIKDLVCQTRMYTDLVGDIRVDGARVPGAIQQNLRLLRMTDERDYLRQIVRAAALQSEAEHRTRDAILLFNLAEEYDTVISVLNKELGASLFIFDPEVVENLNPQATLSAAENTAQLARAILDTYEEQNHIVRRVEVRKRETCRLLLELRRAVAFVRNGETEKGLSSIESTGLFPLSGDVVSISRRAESFFRDIDESIGRTLSELLLMTMDILYKVHTSLKSSNTSGIATAGAGESKEARLAEVRNKARSLMMFAGMLRFRIEQAVFAQLTRLDAFIR